MADINFFKVSSMPTPAVANSVYFVKSGTSTKIYVTDTTGTPVGVNSVDAVVSSVNGLNGNVQLELSLSGGSLSITGGTTPVNLDNRYLKTTDNISWSKITGHPTTLGGYGISDAYTKSEVTAITGSLSNLNTSTKASLVAAINELNTALADQLDVPNPIDCSTNPNYPASSKGDTYKVTAAGKIGGANGVNVGVGDLIICTANTSGGDQATAGDNFFVVESNVDMATESVAGIGRIATQAEVTAGENGTAWVTPATLAGMGYLTSFSESDPVWQADKAGNTEIQGNWTFDHKIRLYDNSASTNVGIDIGSTSYRLFFGGEYGSGSAVIGANTFRSDNNEWSLGYSSSGGARLLLGSGGGLYIETAPAGSTPAAGSSFFTVSEQVATREWVNGLGLVDEESDPVYTADKPKLFIDKGSFTTSGYDDLDNVQESGVQYNFTSTTAGVAHTPDWYSDGVLAKLIVFGGGSYRVQEMFEVSGTLNRRSFRVRNSSTSGWSSWKEVIVSGSNISLLNNNAGYLTAATVPVPDLQAVTNTGNATSKSIIVNDNSSGISFTRQVNYTPTYGNSWAIPSFTFRNMGDPNEDRKNFEIGVFGTNELLNYAFIGFNKFNGLGLRVYEDGTLKRLDKLIWDEGNDGAGSGLDADLLDGKQGSDYLLSLGTSKNGLSLTDQVLQLSLATTNANGAMSSADKTKLNGIATNANNYTLPKASASTLGGIKVGNNLSIDANGVLSASDSTYSAGVGLDLDAGEFSLLPATAAALGGVKVGTRLSITAQGTLSADKQMVWAAPPEW